MPPRPLLLLLLAGCGRGRTAARYAEEACSLFEECGVLSAYSEADTYEDCKEDWEDWAWSRWESESCAYDAGEARACIQAYEEASCGDLSSEDFASSCYLICAGGT